MRPSEELEQDDGSLRQIVQQELEAIIPFSEKVREFLEEIGGMFVMGGQALARSVPFATADVSYQVESLGARSLGIAILVATFAGLVISLQFAFFLARFGVQHTVGKVVVLTLF